MAPFSTHVEIDYFFYGDLKLESENVVGLGIHSIIIGCYCSRKAIVSTDTESKEQYWGNSLSLSLSLSLSEAGLSIYGFSRARI